MGAGEDVDGRRVGAAHDEDADAAVVQPTQYIIASLISNPKQMIYRAAPQAEAAREKVHHKRPSVNVIEYLVRLDQSTDLLRPQTPTIALDLFVCPL